MRNIQAKSPPRGLSPTVPRARLVWAPVLVLAAVLAACGSDQDADSPPDSVGTTSTTRAPNPLPEPVQVLDVEGTEYAFAIEPGATQELRPGWTELTFRNTGAEAHQIMFAQLKEGVDLAQLTEVAGEDSSGSAAIEYVDMLGGVSYIGPGESVSAMVDLPPGQVMAMCYVPDPDGVAHALSGMTAMLTVGTDGGEGSEAGAGSSTPAPESGRDPRGTIEMGPDGYLIPSPLSAGWYRVVNTDRGEDGRGLHELSILGLEEPLEPDAVDGLLDDLAANEIPDVPLVALGGMGALSAGFDGYLYLDLPDGEYLAVDFMPDPGDPRPHLLDGYFTQFQP